MNIHTYFSILVETNGRKQKYCYSKYIDTGDMIHISYIISGENEEKVNCVLSLNDKAIFHQEALESGEYKEESKESGEYTLCFLPLNTNNYYISFEFFTHFEKGHTLDMAKDENVHSMKKDVNNVALMFEDMEKNIKFIMDRRNKHTEVINEIGTQIRHISYLKIVVVVLVSLLQVFLIHRFFAGKKTYNYSQGTSSLFADSL
jgi:hypothetical protein